MKKFILFSVFSLLAFSGFSQNQEKGNKQSTSAASSTRMKAATTPRMVSPDSMKVQSAGTTTLSNTQTSGQKANTRTPKNNSQGNKE